MTKATVGYNLKRRLAIAKPRRIGERGRVLVKVGAAGNSMTKTHDTLQGIM